jgi:hypothetical protein
MVASNTRSQPLFPLGRIVATPGALEALAASGDSAHRFFSRHARGDWGEVCAKDRQANERALAEGARLLSAYRTKRGEKLWIITESGNAREKKAFFLGHPRPYAH